MPPPRRASWVRRMSPGLSSTSRIGTVRPAVAAGRGGCSVVLMALTSLTTVNFRDRLWCLSREDWSISKAPLLPDWFARGSTRHMVSLEIDWVEQIHRCPSTTAATAAGAGGCQCLERPQVLDPPQRRRPTTDSPQEDNRCLIGGPVVRCCCRA